MGIGYRSVALQMDTMAVAFLTASMAVDLTTGGGYLHLPYKRYNLGISVASLQVYSPCGGHHGCRPDDGRRLPDLPYKRCKFGSFVASLQVYSPSDGHPWL